MTDSTEEKPFDVASLLMNGTAFQELLVSQTEGLMKAQVEMFQTMAAIVETWVVFRRESANAALLAFKRMSECESAGTMMNIYAEWLGENAKQIGDEAQALGAKAAELNKAAIVTLQDAARPAEAEEAAAAPAPARAPARESKWEVQPQHAAEYTLGRAHMGE